MCNTLNTTLNITLYYIIILYEKNNIIKYRNKE